MKIPAQYRRSVLIAVALHVALLIFLVVRLAPTLYRAPSTYQPKPFDSIKAVAVLPTQIQPDKTPDVQKAVEAQEKIAKQEMIQKEQAATAQAEKQKEEKMMKIAQQQALEKAQLQAAAEKQKQLTKARAQAEAKKKIALAAQEKLKMERQFAKINQQKLAKQKALTAKQKQLQQALLQQQLNSEAKDLSQIQVKAQQQGQIDKYKAQILALIQSNWRIDEVNSKLKCVYTVALAPDGSVLSATLLKSSGNDNLDQSARQAIIASSPLPVPANPEVFSQFRQLVLTLSPQGYLQSVGEA